MKILIVTPTLGESRWMPQMIESVHVCAPGARHVLVAPTDRVDDLASRFPGVEVVCEPRGAGMYGAINSAVAEAREWDAVGYINDDDSLLPGFSVIAAKAAQQKGRSAVIYGGVKLIDAMGRRMGAIPVSPSPHLNRALYAQRLEPVYQHGTLLTRKAWDSLGGFDSTLRFCGDSDLLARACLAGVPFFRVNREVAAFRLREGQLTKNRPAMITERELIDARLGLVEPQRGWAHRWARARFRAANMPVYAERIARHGFVTFDELLAR